MRACQATGADAASDAAHPLHQPLGRPSFLQHATVAAAIPVAAANDRAQTSLKLENFPQYIQDLKQGENKLAGRNELAVAPIPSDTTLWRLRKALLPENANSHVPTPTRIRALLEPANAQSIAAAVATLSYINSHSMFNIDTTTVTIGNLMSARPKILLALGSKQELGRMNVAPGAPRGENTSMECFPVPLNVTHAADGSQYHVGAVIKHVVFKEVKLFRISSRVSAFFTPINYDRQTYFFHYFKHVVVPMVRVAREDLQRVRQCKSQAVALTPFSAADTDAEVGADGADHDDDDAALDSAVETFESSALPASSSSSANAAAADDDVAMSLSDSIAASDSSGESSTSSPSSSDEEAIIWSAFFCDGDGPQMNMLLSQAVLDVCNAENLAVVKFPAASSARSQPHDRKNIASELHRHFDKVPKNVNGVPSVEMQRFITTDLPTLGLPASSMASLTHFFSHCEAIFAIAISPKRCQESWGDQGTGYRNQKGEMNLEAVLAQYVHWKDMETADAQKLIECECAVLLHCAFVFILSATLCFIYGFVFIVHSHTCSAHPLLVKLIEANGFFTDDEYWEVMTSLGLDKEVYSVRDENEEVKKTTHVTRRRRGVVSNSSFLAERRAQRDEAERKVAAAAAAKLASAVKREADLAIKAANALARAEKKKQKV